MDFYSSQISNLVEQLSHLPGIGSKSAQRLAFHILNMSPDQVKGLADAMTNAKKNVRYCKECCTYTDDELCPICANPKRNHKQIMVVENTRDLAAYEKTGKYENIIYMPCNKENNFEPSFPEEVPDMIYLCFPNNPTGTVLTKNQLAKWVEYAKKNKSIILFDGAYEAFITEKNVPHSIYEIEGAKEVAIEFRSFSKTAGFTGVRCGYTVIPKEVKGYTKDGKEIMLNRLWNRRQCTKFNGASYVTQRGAEAIYTEEGKKEIRENIEYYRENAKIIREGLTEAGFTVYGGVNAPYIWLKLPDEIKSWDFFDKLLNEVAVVGTPGVGFGPSGEGYFRLTAFGSRENTIEAIERIKNNFKI